jgi:phosphotransferase system HPr (HPr) family protein
VAQAVREAKVPNKEGLHARPVMRFVDLASRFKSSIVVANVSGRGEPVDGKSAMQMMLLEAVQGSVIRIEATGEDAPAAVEALAGLIESGCPAPGLPPGCSPPKASGPPDR